MAHLIWLSISISAALFSLAPAVLLGFQYNLAVGVAYFSLSLTLLSIFWDLNDITDQLKVIAKSKEIS